MKSNMISVIIPVYNTAAYLDECVQSIIQQSYQDFELLLIDDGSSDESGALCDIYASKDSRIQVIHKKNGGQSSARNIGIACAEGKYVYFQDSDDLLMEDAIEILYLNAERTNADVVFFEADSFIDPTLKDTQPISEYYRYNRKQQYPVCNGTSILEALVQANEYFVCTPLHFYKRKYFLEHSIRFKEGIIHEDDLFSFQVYLSDGVFAHVHKKLYKRRLRSGSTMTDSGSEMTRYRYESMLSVYYGMHQFIRNKKTKDGEPVIYKCIYIVYKYYNRAKSSLLFSERITHWIWKKHALLYYGTHNYQSMKLTASPFLLFAYKAVHRIINLMKNKQQRCC